MTKSQYCAKLANESEQMAVVTLLGQVGFEHFGVAGKAGTGVTSATRRTRDLTKRDRSLLSLFVHMREETSTNQGH
jgi:hypothetical protein